MTGSLEAYAGAAGTAFVAVILLRAAWHKTAHHLEAVGYAQAYGLLPESRVPIAVRVLAGLEWMAAAALVVPALSAAGASVAALLFAGYGIAMILALRAGRTEIDCGCGGAPMPVSALLVARNAGFVAISASLPFLADGPLPALGAVAAIAAGLTLCAVAGLGEGLAANAARIRKLKA